QAPDQVAHKPVGLNTIYKQVIALDKFRESDFTFGIRILVIRFCKTIKIMSSFYSISAIFHGFNIEVLQYQHRGLFHQGMGTPDNLIAIPAINGIKTGVEII